MLLMMVMVREIRDLRIPSTRQTEMHDDSRYEAHTHIMPLTTTTMVVNVRKSLNHSSSTAVTNGRQRLQNATRSRQKGCDMVI